MKTAIILHGMPSKEEYYNPNSPAQSNKHWLPWIQRQLILKDVLAQAIELPHPYAPNYESWKQTFEQFKIDQDTILIGHSCGAGFLVRYLSENNIKVGKVALVAPWIDPEKEIEPEFFDFEIDKNLINKTSGLCIFVSQDDESAILKTVELIQEAIPEVEIKQFTDKEHFTFRTMQTPEFPELLDWLI